MTAPWETAEADQYDAAVREVANADLTKWLLPDGVEASVIVSEDDSATGPATRAAVLWMDRPKIAGCSLASASPIPLFGLTSDLQGRLWCASCFEQLVSVMFHKDRPEWNCTLCAQPSNQLRPVKTTHVLLTAMAYACEDCYTAERKAVIRSRFTRVAGSLPRRR